MKENEEKKLTPEQENAITVEGNVLVSASAGSGKTTVLVDRIMHFIGLGIGIDRMLVLVYNKQAATQLKNKIAEKLLEKIYEGKSEYQKQLDYLPFARIGTLDSFCFNAVRENFDFFPIASDFSIASDDEMQNYYKRAFKAMLKDYYAALDKEDSKGDGISLIDMMVEIFSTRRSDEGLMNVIIKLYEIKESMPDGDEFLKSLSNDFKDFNDNKYLSLILDEVQKTIKEPLEKLKLKAALLDKETDIKHIENVTGVCYYADEILKAKSADELIVALSKAEFDRWLPPTKAQDKVFIGELKNLRDEINDKVKYFRSNLGTRKESEFSFMQNRAILLELVEAVFAFEKKLNEIKKKNMNFSYSDIEQMTLKLTDSERGKAIKDSLSLVYIDEYQDINRLQETLITRLAPVDSCFMVGDVKQSIYGFRLADSDIFIDKFMRYKSGEGNALELTANFRSKDEILEFVNKLFCKIMTVDTSKIDYASAIFQLGKKKDPKGGRVEIHTFSKPQKTAKAVEGLYDITEDDAEEEELDSAASEGKFIADKIKELLSGGEFKNYKDFAVIARSRNAKTRTVCQTLISEGIPVSGKDFIESDDEAIRDIILLLKAIDNPKNEIPFAGFLLGYFGGYSEEELIELKRSYPAPTLYDSLSAAANGGSLKDKAKATLDALVRYRSEAAVSTVSEFVRELMFGTDYNSYSLAKGDGLYEIERLLCSVENTEADLSVSRFLQYYGSREEEKIQNVPRDNMVSFLTVHASKGLEFPVVFVVNCSEKFSTKTESGELLIEKDGYIGIKGYDTEKKEKKKSLSHFATKIKIRRREFAENIRLFYVAATRAMKYMFLTGEDGSLNDDRSFMALVNSVYSSKIIRHDSVWTAKGKQEVRAEFDKPDKKTVESIIKAQSFVYPYAEATAVPQKQSVSSIVESDSDAFAVTPFAEENMQKGTAYHAVMQNIDFAETDVEGFIRSLVKGGILSEKDAASVDSKEIEACLNSDIIKYAVGKKCERERPFTMLCESGGEKVLVQGIIDLMIYDNGEVVLVDYKNSSKSDRELIETYSKQLEYYKKAIEGKYKVKASVIYSFPRGKAVLVEGKF